MEIEVKILDINKDKIIEKLESLGAKKVFEGDVEAEFYDFNDNRLKGKGQILRLRKKDHIELTFKEKVNKDKAKIMIEHEAVLDDFEGAKRILHALGLKQVSTQAKHRISYKLKELCFELDTLPGLPAYLEIEAESYDLVEKWVKKLGFSMHQAKPWTGFEVIEHYRKLVHIEKNK